MTREEKRKNVDLNKLASEMNSRTEDGLLAAIRRASKAKSDESQSRFAREDHKKHRE